MSGANFNEVTNHLVSKGLTPKPTWVTSFLASQRAGVPAAALKQTALFRLTASDITTTVQIEQHSTFPSDVLDATNRERLLTGPIVVQILDVEDVSRSRWSQLEAIEAEERGETTRGREIIRVVPGDDDESERGNVSQSSGPHKLLLQDAKGTQVYALELTSIEGIGLNMNIGSKLVLRDITVARGVILLEPQRVVVLGGKIDELQRKWKAGRKDALKAAAQSPSTS